MKNGISFIILLMSCAEVKGQMVPINHQTKDSNKVKSVYYDKMEREYYRYSTIKQNGGWDKIKASQRVWKMGDSAETIKKIKQRLRTTEEGGHKDSTWLFDENLIKEIMGFQRRNGLKQDGKVGKETLKEMNISVEERIQQIKLNMERLMQLPEPLGDKYIMVNIPAFTLLAMKKDKIVFTCKIVAGKESDKTALFKGKMKYIVFGPYWNVPNSIMQKEILPALAKNPHYLQDNHMEWYDGKIRQKPGPWNALGGVKFIFPNAYNMYMHDTPAKTLFEEDTRAFSHGCIRVSEPIKLARFLLEQEKDWDGYKIAEAMSSEKEIYINLKEDVAVYIVYFTAYVDASGELNFRKDIYKRDSYLYF